MNQKIKDLIDNWYKKSTAPTNNIVEKAMRSQMADCASELDNLIEKEGSNKVTDMTENRLANGNVENFTIRINGSLAPCPYGCKCNVYHKPDSTQEDLYRCNACHKDFYSE